MKELAEATPRGGDVVELLPSRDVDGLTALTATRLLMLLADIRGRLHAPA